VRPIKVKKLYEQLMQQNIDLLPASLDSEGETEDPDFDPGEGSPSHPEKGEAPKKEAPKKEARSIQAYERPPSQKGRTLPSESPLEIAGPLLVGTKRKRPLQSHDSVKSSAGNRHQSPASEGTTQFKSRKRALIASGEPEEGEIRETEPVISDQARQVPPEILKAINEHKKSIQREKERLELDQKQRGESIKASTPPSPLRFNKLTPFFLECAHAEEKPRAGS